MLCRRAWQRVAPVARRVFGATPRNVVPVRHMAFGIPGGSSNMTYFVLCGGGLTAAVVYAYKTVNGDSDRYEARIASIGSTANEAVPDLLAAVKMLANSTVEIAAASVGETSLMKAVQHIETDSKGSDSTLDVLASEVMEIKTDVVDKEAVSEEAAVSADEEVKATELAESEVASDVVASLTEWEAPTEEISAPNTEEEEAATSPPEEPTPTAPTEEDVGDMKAESQAPALDGSSEEAVFSPESSHKGDAHTGVTTAKSVPVSEELAAVEVAVEEDDAETKAYISVEETPEVEVLLGEATTVSDLEVLSDTEPEAIPETPVEKETEHSHSCHGAPSSAEDEAQPDDSKGHLEVHLVKEEAVDITHEAKEALSLVNDQTTATVVVVTAES